MIYAPKFPLKFDDTYGYANISSAKELVYFHLKNLLFTFPGEKISDPEYGVGIEKYLFENFSDGLFNTVSDTILRSINKYLSYLTVQDVVVFGNAGLHTMNIKIYYFLPTGEGMMDSTFEIK